mmetsp:Transcript_39121/g.92436  ORF Transcript_39121/g.92436 Transcript_39121/m.92436 type:complete len:368 (+) Transcript_39121:770-1873(+)
MKSSVSNSRCAPEGGSFSLLTLRSTSDPCTSWIGSANTVPASSALHPSFVIHRRCIKNARSSRRSSTLASSTRFRIRSSDPPFAHRAPSSTPCKLALCTYPPAASRFASSSPFSIRHPSRVSIPRSCSPNTPAPSITFDPSGVNTHSVPSIVGSNGHPANASTFPLSPAYFQNSFIHSSVGCPSWPALHCTSNASCHPSGIISVRHLPTDSGHSSVTFVYVVIASLFMCSMTSAGREESTIRDLIAESSCTSCSVPTSSCFCSSFFSNLRHDPSAIGTSGTPANLEYASPPSVSAGHPKIISERQYCNSLIPRCLFAVIRGHTPLCASNWRITAGVHGINDPCTDLKPDCSLGGTWTTACPSSKSTS